MKAGSDPKQSHPASGRGWFHCAKCGELFENPLGGYTAPTCPHCHQAADEQVESAPPHHVRQKRRKKRRSNEPVSAGDGRGNTKKMRLALISSGVWFCLLALLVFIVHACFPDGVTKPESNASADYFSSREAEDNQLLSNSINHCQQQLTLFLTESTASSRGDYLAHGLELTGRISQYEASHPVLRSDEAPQLIQAQVLHTPFGDRISSLWKLSDERKIEATFLQEDGVWKLDWPALMQENTIPWTFYITGAGEPTGTFRVFARKREATTSRELEVVLYSPHLGFPDQFSEPTPPIQLKAGTKAADAISKAFEQKSKGTGAFGNNAAKSDPADMIRLRVKLSRSVQGEEKIFQIDEVLADHWMEPWDSTQK